MLRQRQLEQLTVEARARVTWGESVDAVREWLASQKLPHLQVDEILRDVLEERRESMRRRGVHGLFFGAVVLACAVAVVFLPPELEKFGIPAMGRMIGLFFAAAIFLGLIGVKLLVDGMERFLRGAAAEGADSDVSDR
jgi:hypothetical protein